VKLLLDECVLQEFRHLVNGHDVYTVAYKGWSGLLNGALLAAAAADGFDALITTDRGFQFQHNPATLPLAVVILLARSNDLQDLRVLVPELLASLTTLAPRQVTVVGPHP
jgi:hypothetical protein